MNIYFKLHNSQFLIHRSKFRIYSYREKVINKLEESTKICCFCPLSPLSNVSFFCILSGLLKKMLEKSVFSFLAIALLKKSLRRVASERKDLTRNQWANKHRFRAAKVAAPWKTKRRIVFWS